MGDYKKLVFFYLDHIWRRRWSAILFAWTVAFAGWTAVSLLPDKYESEARVFVDTQSLLNPLLKGISVRADDPKRDQDVAVMQRTLTSRPNLAKVAQLTDMDKSVRSAADLQELLDRLQSRIEVTNQGNNLFRVKFVDNSASMAKRVVQALLTIFVENNVGDRRADMQGARSFIETQLAEYEGKLREAEKRMADFKIANMGYLSNTGGTDFTNRIETARTNLKKYKNELEDLTAQRDQLKLRLAETPQFLSIDSAPQIIVGDNGGSLQQRARALQKRIDDLRLQYTEKHPEVARARSQLKDLQQQIAAAASAPRDPNSPNQDGRDRSEITNEVHSQLSIRLAELEGKITSTKRRVEEGESDLEELKKMTVEGLQVESQLTALNRDYQVLRTNYDSLLTRRESARIGEAADSTADSVQFRIIAEPEEPAYPSGPKRRIFNFVVFIASVLAGCGFVILLVHLNDCVTVADDLRGFANYPVLGNISNAVTIGSREPFLKTHLRFSATAGGLLLAFAIVLLTTPNISMIPGKIAMRLSQ